MKCFGELYGYPKKKVPVPVITHKADPEGISSLSCWRERALPFSGSIVFEIMAWCSSTI